MSASFLGALCLFSSVCVLCAISAFTLPIETKGRALQVSDSVISLNYPFLKKHRTWSMETQVSGDEMFSGFQLLSELNSSHVELRAPKWFTSNLLQQKLYSEAVATSQPPPV